MRAQKAGEELRWTECEKRFALPEDWVTEPLPPREVPLEEGEEEEEEVLPMPGDVPRTLRSVLQCALHFHEAQGTPLVVFHASSQPFLPPTPTTTRPGDLRAPPPETDFLSLSSGTPLASYAPFFALPLQSITTSEVGEAREWAKAVQSAKVRGRGGRGGGEGRGGGDGRGRGGERGRGRGKGKDDRGRGRGGVLFVP